MKEEGEEEEEEVVVVVNKKEGRYRFSRNRISIEEMALRTCTTYRCELAVSEEKLAITARTAKRTPNSRPFDGTYKN
jgi:hypothetical protein